MLGAEWGETGPPPTHTAVISMSLHVTTHQCMQVQNSLPASPLCLPVSEVVTGLSWPHVTAARLICPDIQSPQPWQKLSRGANPVCLTRSGELRGDKVLLRMLWDPDTQLLLGSVLCVLGCTCQGECMCAMASCLCVCASLVSSRMHVFECDLIRNQGASRTRFYVLPRSAR